MQEREQYNRFVMPFDVRGRMHTTLIEPEVVCRMIFKVGEVIVDAGIILGGGGRGGEGCPLKLGGRGGRRVGLKLGN